MKLLRLILRQKKEKLQKVKDKKTEVDKLKQAVKDVNEYQKQLNKAHGTYTIDQQMEQTNKYVSELITKLGKAKNEEEFNNIKAELEAQKELYYNEYSMNDNKTLDGFFNSLDSYTYKGKPALGV